MNETGSITLEQVVSLARQLPPLEKIRLIEQMAPEIERDMLSKRPFKRKSLLGLRSTLQINTRGEVRLFVAGRWGFDTTARYG